MQVVTREGLLYYTYQDKEEPVEYLDGKGTNHFMGECFIIDERIEGVYDRMGRSDRYIERLEARIGGVKLILTNVRINTLIMDCRQVHFHGCRIDEIDACFGHSIIYCSETIIGTIVQSIKGCVEIYPDEKSSIEYSVKNKEGTGGVYIPKERENTIRSRVVHRGNNLVDSRTSRIVNTRPLLSLRELCANIIGSARLPIESLPTDLTQDRTLTCILCGVTSFETAFKVDSREQTTCYDSEKCRSVGPILDTEKLRLSSMPRKGYMVKELRVYCKHFGIKLSGKRKKDMVEALMSLQ